jgi:hypothetical protein
VSWVRALQHLSSILGLLLVVGFVWRDVHRAQYHGAALERPLAASERHRWFAAYAAVAVAAAAVAFFVLVQRGPWHAAFMWTLSSAAIGSLWGLATSLLLVSVFVRIRLRSIA